MSTSLKNLSEYDKNSMPDASDLTIGIAVSEWNRDITNALLEGAVKTLKDNGVKEENIIIHYVPGSFELPLAAKLLIDNEFIDAVICIGCVIQGETRHFEFICQAVSQGIMRVNLDTDIPVVFGVLTTDNLEQAKERSGRTHGNKGVEAAITAIKMATLKNNLEEWRYANDLEEELDKYDFLKGKKAEKTKAKSKHKKKNKKHKVKK